MFRFVLPSFWFNQNPNYSAVVANLLRSGNDKFFIDNYNVPMDVGLLRWANYIVLPPRIDTISFFVDDIKSVNPNVKVCMDIDKIYHQISSKTNDYTYYNVPRLKSLVNNMAKSDIVFVPDVQVRDYYVAELGKDGIEKDFRIIPNMINPLLIENLSTKPTPTSNVFKILIYTDDFDYEDVSSNRSLIETIYRKYPKVKFVAYGKNLNHKSKNVFRNLNVEFIEQKSVFNTYNDLIRIAPNLSFVPLAQKDENYRTNYKLLELMAANIPILTYNQLPYSSFKGVFFMGDKKKDIIDLFDKILKNPPLAAKKAKIGFDLAWGSFNLDKNQKYHEEAFKHNFV